MNPNPKTMEGSANFYMFAYLRQAAWSLFNSAKRSPEGSNYRRVASVLFAAFTIEAHLNHLGETKLSSWSIDEPRLSWKAKLELLAQQLKIELDYSKRPFLTVNELFKFRNKLAHGKTQAQVGSYEYKGNLSDDFALSDPEWLKPYWSDESVERVLQDVEQILEIYQEKAGFSKDCLDLISSGAFEERSEKE